MRLINIKLPSTFLGNRSRRMTKYLTMFGVVLGIAGVLAMLAMPKTAYASGGVGSGGSGGGSGVGHYTYYGWGWAIYDTNGPGPTDGFRNGSSWASAQSTCQSANATQVYAFVISNVSGTDEVYDYLNEDGPPQFAAHYAAGTIVDNGNATAIDSSQAQGAFDSLPSYGVDTSGFTFGGASGNVGWFCYNFAQPKTTVGGHVYNTTTGTYMSGVQIATCMSGSNPANVWTDANGYFGFTVNQGTGYCLRIVAGTAAGSYTSAFWMTQFPYNKYHPGISSYEYQLAGTNCFETGAEGNIYCGDRNVYWGYDLNWPSGTFDSWGSQGMDFNVTNLTVQAHVFKVDASGNNLGDVSGATLTTCASPATITTGTNGFAYINGLAPGAGFCLRVSSSAPVGYSGPFVRPWAQGYYTNDNGSLGGPSGPSCPSLSPNPPNGWGGPPFSGHCSNATYEWQVAGSAQNYRSEPTGTFFDRNLVSLGQDGGYDFVYVRNAQVDLCPNIAGSQPTVPDGWVIDSSGNCSQPDYPYMRVYGGDVLAGSGFGSCTPNNAAQIIGWNDGNGAGAGVQLAAQAMAAINQFTTATLRGSTPKPPDGLAFANTGAGVDPTYGGNFGDAPCATDYFNTVTNYSDPGLTAGGAVAVPGSSPSTNYSAIANSEKLILRHDGDVQINGNIIYTSSGTWANLSQIPSFVLIVRGNIYIQKTVTQLDGLYIAQPDISGNKGTIYTCANGTSLYTASTLDANCNTKLTINGAFIAKKVKFLRTNGSLKAQAATPYGWSGWQKLNSSGCGTGTAPNTYVGANKQVGVASWGPGRLDVFYRGTDNQLKHCYTDNADQGIAATWTFENLGGSPNSAPDAVSWGSGRIDVVVTFSTDGMLHHIAYGATGWGSWETFTTGCISNGAAVTSWASGRIDVMENSCSSAGLLEGNQTGATWSGLVNNTGGATPNDTAAVSWGPNRLDFFLRGNDNFLWHNYWPNGSGAFAGWFKDTGPQNINICSGPAATAPAGNNSFGNRLDIFAMGCNGSNLNNGKLYQTTWNGSSWSALNQVDGNNTAAGDPAAVSWGDNRFDVVGVNTDANPKVIWDYYDVVDRPNDPAAIPTEASSSANIAEVFNYSPELFIIQLGNIVNNGEIDAITSLPPIL